MNWLIYTLSCPLTGDIRYVGKTNSFIKRLRQHKSDQRSTAPVKAWIKGLKDKGLLPVMEVIDEIEHEDGKWLELFWIQQVKAWGFSLLNVYCGSMPDHIKKRISAANKGQMAPRKAIETLSKPVCCYNMNGDYLRSYPSVISACRDVNNFGIWSAIKRNRTSGGLRWKYKDENYMENIGVYIPFKPDITNAIAARRGMKFSTKQNAA